MDNNCHVCDTIVGQAHQCAKCHKHVHLFKCGKPIGEEGYGQKVICNTCNTAEGKPKRDQVNSTQKRQLVWDWKKGSRAEKVDIPEKRKKTLVQKKDKNADKYICLQCFELSLQGKQDEKCASICRIDQSSIKRHKHRWHTSPNPELCKFVPSTALDVQELRKKYKFTESGDLVEMKKTLETGALQSKEDLNPEKESFPNESDRCSVSTFESLSINNSAIESFDDSLLDSYQDLEEKPMSSSVQTQELLDTEVHDEQSLDVHKPSAKSQSTLLCYSTPQSNTSKEDLTLQHVMGAISNLSIKMDNISKQHASLTELAFEDSEVRTSVNKIREANNIVELNDASPLLQWFYDEITETAVLRCLPCSQLQQEAKPSLAKLTPLQAQRILNSSGSGTLATGIFLKKDKTQALIKGHNGTWYHQKTACIEHLCLIGFGSKQHKRAMEIYKQRKLSEEKRATSTSNIFRAAIVDIKMGAAGKHLETLVSFLACCSANVGSIGHGRNNFNDILSCLESTVNARMKKWLMEPLTSTLLPPHYWATVDKSTPSRTTNQAVLVVARDETGTPCPIPVAAPVVYTEFQAATYDKLADILLQSIEDNFAKDVITRLCGVATDGPYYQARAFRDQLVQRSFGIEAKDCEDIFLPITWDVAHLINLGVLDVKASQTPSGTHFQKFIKRCNVFNTLLANGKGFAFLQMVDQDARRPVSYATQRLLVPHMINGPGGQFKGVDLLEGWLITKIDSDRDTPGNSEKLYTWKMRGEEDIERDHNQFALDLMNAVEKRINSTVTKPYLTTLEIFDAGRLVSLQCGRRQDNGNVKLSVSEGEYESYGAEESKAVMKSISNLPHIISSGMDFDERLAHRNMLRIKETIFAGVWNCFCPLWFRDEHNNPLPKKDADLIEITPSNSDTLFDVMYILKYSDGEEFTARLHEQSVYSSFYSQEEVYSIAKAPSCVMIDVVLAKGGPEAIAESYYSAMRAQQQ
ncbi:Hypothetical predicted protein [Paramuricea clavata]|uniref:SCAN domain-containing protein n=1 Tax=Paramuricea clavata TaxID=317549 RepID=A0A6S7GKB4_PARCT|nr:Hypothetical predicted protein [Paramuricea clavata]